MDLALIERDLNPAGAGVNRVSGALDARFEHRPDGTQLLIAQQLFDRRTPRCLEIGCVASDSAFPLAAQRLPVASFYRLHVMAVFPAYAHGNIVFVQDETVGIEID